MPITMECREKDPGARPTNDGDRDLWVADTHHGHVLRLGERNGYHDSDFFAVVWNPEKGEPEEIVYASTRGPTYANGAVVDATEEVLAAHAEWERERRAAAARGKDEWLNRMAAEAKIGRPALERLMDVYEEETVYACMYLLRGLARRRLRSKFRESLARQIKAWCDTEEPEYGRPLSRRQFDKLAGLAPPRQAFEHRYGRPGPLDGRTGG